MTQFRARRTEIVRRMFVATADDNYILARIAFKQHAAYDFLWLSLHALEKYFKAIRLLNGMTRNDSHDIASLYSECIARFPGSIISRFEFSKEERKNWHPESVKEFIIRLNILGAAENRYATYGFNIFPDDLAKVDSLVWSLRRCCIDFEHYSKFRNENHGEKETLELLKKDKKHWKISGSLPVEKLLEKKGDSAMRERFLLGNKPWGADTWIEERLRWSSNNSPFAEMIDLVGSEDTIARQHALEVLIWAKANIFFSKGAEKELDNAIAQASGHGHDKL
ncbi:hypothetical protein ACCT07_34665 [Rhizobium johnstonii]|uniref:hypothetical protein n=1 Tax=Rhizobium johnstonii TaxID=3019933 RepID=UPI003F9C3846